MGSARRSGLVLGLAVCITLTAFGLAIAAARSSRRRPASRPIAARRSVRFDAGYYYVGLTATQLAEALAAKWAEQGVSQVYFYAYNPIYGARYHTTYAGNIMEDWGRLDLLGEMLDACHRHGIRVIAWLYGPIHQQVWETHPEWREKEADGSDYLPNALPYRLCVVHPDFRDWWAGFIQDLLDSYPDLDGIDIAEPEVAEWGDTACYNPVDTALFEELHPHVAYPGPEWRIYRGDTLTGFLQETAALCHQAGREFHVTQTLTAWADGTLATSDQLRDAIGFDLDGILSDGDYRPDVFVAELIWQQWQAAYGAPEVFTPAWTAWGTQQALARVAGRAALLSHVELVDFGVGGLDGAGTGLTAQAALAARPFGLDVYDTSLLDVTPQAWDYLTAAWSVTVPEVSTTVTASPVHTGRATRR
jgi:hypothetical protein